MIKNLTMFVIAAIITFTGISITEAANNDSECYSNYCCRNAYCYNSDKDNGYYCGDGYCCR